MHWLWNSHRKVHQWFGEYILQFPEYNSSIFIDFIVIQLHRPSGDMQGLIDWYRNRANDLQKEYDSHKERE